MLARKMIRKKTAVFSQEAVCSHGPHAKPHTKKCIEEHFSAGVRAEYGIKPYGALALESETGFLQFSLLKTAYAYKFRDLVKKVQLRSNWVLFNLCQRWVCFSTHSPNDVWLRINEHSSNKTILRQNRCSTLSSTQITLSWWRVEKQQQSQRNFVHFHIK